VHVQTADVTAYVTTRQTEKAANATINRELAALKKMFSLALAGERIHRAPKIAMLREDNVRQGFFDREQFGTEAIYRRYAIVDEIMLREAAEKLASAERSQV